MQQLHFGLIGLQLRQLVGVAGHRVGGDQRVEIMLHGAGDRIGRRRVAVDVEGRGIV